jgi:hypothetical protein
MLLFFEIFTLASALVAWLHAWARRGAAGAWLLGSLLALGWIRETFVALRDLLYGFPVLDLIFGGTPVMAAVIWSFSIYAGICWWEEVSGWRWSERPPAMGPLGAVAGFMVLLACFYEPFLALTGMARWEPGTRTTAGVPWIALIGYPSLTLLFLAGYGAVVARWPAGLARLLTLALLLPGLAVAHAWGLQQLKRALDW